MKQRQSGHIAVIILGVIILAVVAASFYYLGTKQHKKVATTTASTNVQPKVQSPAQPAVKTEDLTKLPLGDGKVSTSPKKGYVMSCQQNFNAAKAGAQHDGPWISGSTWDLTAKTTVDGSVMWSSAQMSITLSGATRTISGNGLPVKLPTGVFPIQPSSTAYQYDRNPNSIQTQQVFYRLPANPTAAASPSCVPMGVIGYMNDGVALFNALDAGGRDAAAHEVQDKCDGHPQQEGVYHYHSLSRCIEATEGNNQLLGYALDGYGIFGNKDAQGNVITTDDLDECHGITSPITWDGKTVNMYHYVLTHDYPYSIGCFKGTSVRP